MFDLNERHKERRKLDPDFRKRRNEAVERWRQKNKERKNATTLAWQKADRLKNPEKWKTIELKNRCRKYGKTVEWYEAQLNLQNQVCAICGQPDPKRSLSIDHSHKTGQVRGLLCSSCNLELHQVEDSGWLERATQYLKNFEEVKGA